MLLDVESCRKQHGHLADDDTQMDRQTDRQIDRQIDGQIDSDRYVHICIVHAPCFVRVRKGGGHSD